MKHVDEWSNSPLCRPFVKGQAGEKAAPDRRFKPLLFIGLLVLLLLSGRASHAQSTNPGWQLLTETSGVKAYCLQAPCGTQDYVYLKIVNEAQTTKRVVWTVAAHVGQQSVSPMATMEPQALAANQELGSDCAHPSQLLSIPVPAGFNLANLQFNLILLP